MWKYVQKEGGLYAGGFFLLDGFARDRGRGEVRQARGRYPQPGTGADFWGKAEVGRGWRVKLRSA